MRPKIMEAIAEHDFALRLIAVSGIIGQENNIQFQNTKSKQKSPPSYSIAM